MKLGQVGHDPGKDLLNLSGDPHLAMDPGFFTSFNIVKFLRNYKRDTHQKVIFQLVDGNMFSDRGQIRRIPVKYEIKIETTTMM